MWLKAGCAGVLALMTMWFAVPAFGAGMELAIDAQAVMEILPLALKAVQIQLRANEREAAHAEDLRKKGIAEVPACDSDCYLIDAAGLTGFVFDRFGEFYIDKRFVTADEMQVVHAIENWFRKWIARKPPAAVKALAKRESAAGLPVFRGFEDARYQAHDALILRLTREFNAHKAEWCGGRPEQAAKIAALSPALVKAHMIEESGGNGPRSVAAWTVDPVQVNVPGDWGEEKELVGLKRPSRRNEGTVEQNVRAAIMYLARKGFSAAARPAKERPKGYFDGWLAALRRYNGRRDRTDTERYYSDEYADKIVRRAADPSLFVPIEIKLKR